MNALKSMMKATARVRRDGTEAQIPAEELVVGDVVLISAGDQVPADGRIVEASALMPALALLVLWELGKYVARPRQETT